MKNGMVLGLAALAGVGAALALSNRSREMVLSDGRVIVLDGWKEKGSFRNRDSDEVAGLLAEIWPEFQKWDGTGVGVITFAEQDYAFLQDDDGTYWVFIAPEGKGKVANATL